MTAGIVVHLIGYFISITTVNDDTYSGMSGAAKVLLALYPNLGFWLGIRVMMNEEGNHTFIEMQQTFLIYDEVLAS